MNEVDVTCMNFLNVLVENFAIHHALSGVCVDSLIRRPPKAIVKISQDKSVDDADKNEA